MIAINRPPSENTADLRGKMVTLKKRDVNPTSASNPVFVNERLTPSAVECMPGEDGQYQTCLFTDMYGQKTSLGNIGFINQQVSNPVINVFRHPNGSLVTRIDFKDPPNCEIFGVYPSLTLKCSDMSKKGVFTPPQQPYN